jgi:hypothetical protein
MEITRIRNVIKEIQTIKNDDLFKHDEREEIKKEDENNNNMLSLEDNNENSNEDNNNSGNKEGNKEEITNE